MVSKQLMLPFKPFLTVNLAWITANSNGVIN